MSVLGYLGESKRRKDNFNLNSLEGQVVIPDRDRENIKKRKRRSTIGICIIFFYFIDSKDTFTYSELMSLRRDE